MCACVCRCRESRGAMERRDALFIPAAGTPTKQGRHSLDKDRQTSIEGALAIVSRIDDVLSTLKAAGPADTHGWGSSGAKLCCLALWWMWWRVFPRLLTHEASCQLQAQW